MKMTYLMVILTAVEQIRLTQRSKKTGNLKVQILETLHLFKLIFIN